MVTSSSERALKVLVQDVISADDPTLCERVCNVLGAMLTDYGDHVDEVYLDYGESADTRLHIL